MAEQVAKMKCPFCEGRGELERSTVSEMVASPELRRRLEIRIEEIVRGEEIPVAASEATERNFQKEVHTWNPQIPMWRRSPKE